MRWAAAPLDPSLVGDLVLLVVAADEAVVAAADQPVRPVKSSACFYAVDRLVVVVRPVNVLDLGMV